MFNKINLILALANMLISYFAFSQDAVPEKVTISGSLSFDTLISKDLLIHLIDYQTNTVFKIETLQENNTFRFDNVLKATYILKIIDQNKTLFTGESFVAKTNLDLGTIPINTNNTVLEEVVVTKSKPYLERQQGKTILNVNNSVGSTGSSAFEILEKAPSVAIDNNDNISLRGKTGLIIQIDGKPTLMTGSNLATFLKGIPSESIDKIEFITNPSAKYDAEGSAIINIKLKKGKKTGLNGSISTSYGQGIYSKNNNSLNLNQRTEKMNLFGSYSFVYRENFNELLLKRQFFENNLFTGAFEQHNFLKMNFRNHLGRIGADYTINKKHTLGIVVNKASNKFNPTGNNGSDVFDQTNTKTSRFETQNHSRDNRYNQAVNVNHKYTIDTLGTELTTDFDYANYGNKTKQNFKTRYFDSNHQEFQNPYLLHGDLKGDLTIFSLKTDYVTLLKNNFKMETGIKSSYVKADNNLLFFNVSSGVPVLDPTKSNHFIYQENINAAYVAFSKEFTNWSFHAGLRMENTNITGKQLINTESFKDSYVQLFPNATFSYTLNDNHAMELNYSRRITRPSYDQLNPFKFFLDPSTYKAGNPYLKPQSTHAVELTHTFKQKFITTLSFSRTIDNITDVLIPSEDNQHVSIQTNKNLNNADIIGLFSIIPIEFTKWWTANNSLNLYYGSYSGTIAQTTLNNKGNFTYNFNSTHTFKLSNGFSAELTGNYRAREVYAFMDIKPIWFVNMGIQKKFKNESVLRLNATDLFYSNKTTAFNEITGYEENFKVARDTRVVTLSYTYNFGKNSSQQRKRNTGADDLKQRAGSSNS